jgi:hypothetical protein
VFADLAGGDGVGGLPLLDRDAVAAPQSAALVDLVEAHDPRVESASQVGG